MDIAKYLVIYPPDLSPNRPLQTTCGTNLTRSELQAYPELFLFLKHRLGLLISIFLYKS